MVRGHQRFTVIFYLNKIRVRRTFEDLEKARQEARIAAQKIHEGLG